MGTAYIVFRQTVVMFLYMSAGYCLFKTEKMTYKGSRDIATLLVWLVIPVVLVNSFCVERSMSRIIELLQSAFVTALSLVIAMAIAKMLFRDRPIDNFGAAFSNAGFIGIPLVQAALGDDAVFWIVSMVAMMNMLQWSYGVGLLTGERSAVGLRHLIFNPILVGIGIGLILFFTGIHVPVVIEKTISTIAAGTVPLSMLIIGTSLGGISYREIFTDWRPYVISGVRLLVCPLLCAFIFRHLTDNAMMLGVLVILSACPPAVMRTPFCIDYGQDATLASKTICIATVLSMITIPLVLWIAL